MLYFAYGSNLDQEQMTDRCPTSVVAGRATLPAHRLIFAARAAGRHDAFASVAPDPGASVPGLLYHCSLEDLASLDRFEGCPVSYRRRVLIVVDDNDCQVPAQVYVKPTTSPSGRPSAAYLTIIHDAYLRLGFDDSRLQEYWNGEEHSEARRFDARE
jgi:gamma-glutamylcyclotransferase (GGCT)/AIG2-like uncharacterized protein YtfP